MFSFRRLICLTATLMALPFMTAFGQNVSSNLLERAKAAGMLAAASAVDAGIMRDLAVNAVRNAIASQNDSGEIFLLAVKSGDKAKRMASRKAYNGVAETVSEAIASLESIVDYAADAAGSAESARQLEKVAIAATSQRDAESAIKKAERAAEYAGKSARKAQVLAEVLKKAWLLPIPQAKVAATASVESVVQPAAIR